MENSNTIEFDAIIQSCNRKISLSDGELSVILKIIVTGGEKESKEVDNFIGNINSRENIKVQIVRDE